MTITLNGDPLELTGPLTVNELLTHLDIDPRRVAVEHNLIVVKQAVYDSTVVKAGDDVEESASAAASRSGDQDDRRLVSGTVEGRDDIGE